MNKTKVSVIIPVFNAEKYLERCLNSIINQSLKEIEIICVDDASTDNSLNILKDFSKKDNRIQYRVQHENSGAGIARNRGMEYATGEFISFIDSDDFVIDNTAYEKLYEYAVECKADIVSANLNIYKNGEFQNNPFSNIIKCTSYIKPQEYGIPWYFQKNLYRKQFLKENNIEFPDYRNGEDPLFLTKVLVNVDFVYCLPVDFYAYTFACKTSPYKINSEKSEIDYIKHFRDVLTLLNNSKFEKTYLEYEKSMYKFFVDHTFTFPSKSLDKNIKDIFKDDTKTLRIYELNCLLWEKNNEIQKLKRTLSKKEKIIQDIMISNSWKLTKFLRKVGLLLRNIFKNKSVAHNTKTSK